MQNTLVVERDGYWGKLKNMIREIKERVGKENGENCFKKKSSSMILGEEMKL